MRTLNRLLVARKAHDLTLKIYEETAGFPAAERFGLTGQVRRAAVSIGSNIAEGDGRDSNAGFARHLGIALGSANEANYQLLLARDLGWLKPASYDDLAGRLREIRAMLLGLSTEVRKRPPKK